MIMAVHAMEDSLSGMPIIRVSGLTLIVFSGLERILTTPLPL